MQQILARNLTDELVAALKRRASRNHHSMAQEIRIILEESLSADMGDAETVALRIKEHLAAKGISFSDSSQIQSEDRLR